MVDNDEGARPKLGLRRPIEGKEVLEVVVMVVMVVVQNEDQDIKRVVVVEDQGIVIAFDDSGGGGGGHDDQFCESIIPGTKPPDHDNPQQECRRSPHIQRRRARQ